MLPGEPRSTASPRPHAGGTLVVPAPVCADLRENPILSRVSWRTLNHTADVQLEIEAETWSALLVEATRAFALWSTEGRSDGAPAAETRDIEVRGTDRIETWVGYWRALHRLWTVAGLMPCRATLEAPADGTHVRGIVECIPAAALDPTRCADVKAVTWHAAAVEVKEERWIGSIVLDL
jgi:SHS2 domain-containing protein